MQTKKRPAPGSNQEQAHNTKKRQSHYNSKSAQQHRILKALLRQPLTTIEAREKLDILHPCGRVLELRRQGWPIITVWVSFPTDCGRLHRVGKYIMETEGRPV
jgi:hypothetical protein